MEPYDSLKANERMIGTFSSFASPSDLEGLGDLAAGVIGGELGKASLASEDHVEEVFQNSQWKMLDRCSGNKPPVRAFRPFFLTVCRHESRRYMRRFIREERTQRLGKEWQKVLNGTSPLPPEPLQDERPIVLKALAHLPRRHRLIITWMYIESLSADEVKTRLEHTDGKKHTNGAVRQAIHRARKALAALREILAREAEMSDSAEGNKLLPRASSL
jgi:DNA-directed RNA polymerase specialized sigma24 family protein